jgi:hypothetical protein
MITGLVVCAKYIYSQGHPSLRRKIKERRKGCLEVKGIFNCVEL